MPDSLKNNNNYFWRFIVKLLLNKRLQIAIKSAVVIILINTKIIGFGESFYKYIYNDS